MSKNSIALERLTMLFDGEFTEIDAFAKSAEGELELAAGFGTVGGAYAYAFSQDSTVSGGEISVAQCAKIKKIYDLALKTGYPVIGVFDTNGVKLTEGFEVLEAYGELVKASARLSGVVPQVSLIAGACVGTSALIANLADVVIAIRDADFYVTAPSDISVEKSAKDGVVDIVSEDFESAVESVKAFVSLLPSNNLDVAGYFEASEPEKVCADGMNADELISAIADSGISLELKADYGKCCVTKLCAIGGETVGIIAFNDKSFCAKGAYKAEAMVKLCDAFSIPLITIANAKGLKKGKETQMLVAVTKLTSAYAAATCPKISLITSESIGAAYIILAGKGNNADLTFAWDNAVVSPLETESAVAFLFSERLADGESRKDLEKEYKETIGSSFAGAACGAIDDVFTPDKTRAKIIAALDMISGKRETTLPRKHSVK